MGRGDQATKTITILYFAALSEQLGTDKELLDLPEHIETIAQLKQHLAQRPSPWPALLQQKILCAANQEISSEQHILADKDEIAFFPPVTGG